MTPSKDLLRNSEELREAFGGRLKISVAESVTILTIKGRPLRLFALHETSKLKLTKRPSLAEGVTISAKC